MKQISNRATTFFIVMLLLVASCPYALSVLMSAHGNHQLSTSVQGNTLKVTLQHVDDGLSEESDHSHHPHTHKTTHSTPHHHEEGTNGESHDHVVLISAYQVTTPSPVTVKAQKVLSVLLPLVASFYSKPLEIINRGFWRIDKSEKPPGYLAHHRTIVLHI